MSHEATISRILKAYGIQEKWGATSALADKLGTKGNVVSGWRSRGVPIEVIAKVSRDTNVSVGWLESGEGGMHGGWEPPEAESGVSHINTALLRDVIHEVENHKRGKTLPPDKKAELIALLYEEFLEEGQVKKEKVTRLVGLAS